MWHTDDLLEGSFVVPATTYNPGITAVDDTLPLLGRVQVSRLLPPGSLDRTHWINADTQAISENENGAHDGHDDDTDDDDDVDDDADREGEDEDPNDDGAHDLNNKPERG